MFYLKFISLRFLFTQFIVHSYAISFFFLNLRFFIFCWFSMGFVDSRFSLSKERIVILNVY